MHAVVVISLLAAYWIATAWPSGVTLVQLAAPTCALSSSSPTPARTVIQMGFGAALAVMDGMLLAAGITCTVVIEPGT